MSTLAKEIRVEELRADAARLRGLEVRAVRLETEAGILEQRARDLGVLADKVRLLVDLADHGTDALPRRASALEAEARKLDAEVAIKRDADARQARDDARGIAAPPAATPEIMAGLDSALRTFDADRGSREAERFYLCRNLGVGRFMILGGGDGFPTDCDALDAAEHPYEVYPGHVILPGVLASLRDFEARDEVTPADDPDVRLIQGGQTYRGDSASEAFAALRDE